MLPVQSKLSLNIAANLLGANLLTSGGIHLI